MYVRWNGGGGVGDPLDREPASVVIDVINEVISPEAAREIFGVEIQGEKIDAAKTEKLRKSIREERLLSKGGK